MTGMIFGEFGSLSYCTGLVMGLKQGSYEGDAATKVAWPDVCIFEGSFNQL